MKKAVPFFKDQGTTPPSGCVRLIFFRQTKAVTRVSETHVPDEVYEEAKRHFNEKELADLTLAVVAINGWNRLLIAGRTTPGTYQPVKKELKKAA